jgi:hypothetical protein
MTGVGRMAGMGRVASMGSCGSAQNVEVHAGKHRHLQKEKNIVLKNVQLLQGCIFQSKKLTRMTQSK